MDGVTSVGDLNYEQKDNRTSIEDYIQNTGSSKQCRLFLSEQKDCIILKKITFEENDSRTSVKRLALK